VEEGEKEAEGEGGRRRRGEEKGTENRVIGARGAWSECRRGDSATAWRPNRGMWCKAVTAAQRCPAMEWKACGDGVGVLSAERPAP